MYFGRLGALVAVMFFLPTYSWGRVISLFPSDSPSRLEKVAKEILESNDESATSYKVVELSGGIHVFDAVRFKNLNFKNSPLIIRGKKDQAGNLLSVIRGVRKPGQSGQGCVNIRGSSNIIFENLKIENCWPTFVDIKDSTHITLRDSHIIGSKNVVYVKGGESEHFIVSRNEWIQDPTRKIWNEHDWSELHHGNLEFFNGGLFQSKDIKGNVEFSYNNVSYAFNAIRMNGKKEDLGLKNVNVNIHNNRFSYVRDNIVEPEGTGLNWWIHHNSIHNAHAWFSLTEAALSHFYFFGNTGYNSEKPCKAGSKFSHCGGKVFKLEKSPPYPVGPIKIFRNSWYATGPVFKGGPSRYIQHWNNAIEFSNEKFTFLSEAPMSESYFFDFDLSNNLIDMDLGKLGLGKNSLRSNILFVNGKEGKFALASGSPGSDVGVHRSVSGQVWRYEGKGPDVGAFEKDNLMVGPKFKPVAILPPVYMSATQTIKGDYDGQGRLHIWQGEGDCSQKEGMPPAFILRDHSSIRNLTLIGAPDGIHIKGEGTRIENVHFPDVCEDAITLKKEAQNSAIIGNTFEQCADKGIQVNATTNLKIRDNHFFNCRQPIRVKPGSKKVIVEGNFISLADSGVRVTGLSEVSFRNNDIYHTSKGVWLEGNVTFTHYNNRYRSGAREIVKSYPRVEFLESERKSRTKVLLDVEQDGAPGKAWKKCVEGRLTDLKLNGLESNKVPLSKDQFEWHSLFLEAISEWVNERSYIENHFPFKKPELFSLKVVMGNQGGNDGFTQGESTICFDLSNWAKQYDLSFSGNIGRIKRVLSHEYAHLLTKRLGVVEMTKVSAFKDKVVFNLFYEGIGDYFSLSSKWIRKDGTLTRKAKSALIHNLPRFKANMSKIMSGSKDTSLLDQITSGPFPEKWGSLTVALWLSRHTSRKPENLSLWIAGGEESGQKMVESILKSKIDDY